MNEQRSYGGSPVSPEVYAALAEAGLVPMPESLKVGYQSQPTYVTAPSIPETPSAIDGLPLHYLQGQYIASPNRQRPSNALLDRAAAEESSQYRGRLASEQPHTQTLENHPFGWLGRQIDPSSEVPGTPYDYRGNLLNQGMNPSRGAFVNAYDAQRAAENAPVIPSELTGQGIPLRTDAGAFVEVSPAEREKQRQNAIDYAQNALLSFHPSTAVPMALANTIEGSKAAYNEAQAGNSRNAIINAAGALTNALVAVPGVSPPIRAAVSSETAPARAASASVSPSYMATADELARAQWTPAQMAKELGISEAQAVQRQARFNPAPSVESIPFQKGDLIQLQDKDGVLQLAKPAKITDIQHDPTHGSWVQVEGSNTYFPMSGAVKAGGAQSSAPMHAIVGLPFGAQRDEALAAYRGGMQNQLLAKNFGVVIGADGVPRREILDAGVPINTSIIRKGGTVPLQEVLPNHGELFDAVPGLRNALVTGSDIPRYNAGENTIYALANPENALAQRKKFFEAIQTAIQNEENLAGAAHHEGNIRALNNVRAASIAAKNEGVQGAQHYDNYLSSYTGVLNSALKTGEVNRLPYAPAHHVFAPGSPEASRAADEALRRISAGRYEKRIVGKRSLQTPENLPALYEGGQVRAPMTMSRALVVPTPENLRDPNLFADFIRNWYAIRR